MQVLLRWRKFAALLAGLLILTVLYVQPPVSAAGTASYVYVVDGEELVGPFDPIALKSGLLLPEGLLKALGVTVSTDGSSITLIRGSQVMRLSTRSQLAAANGGQVSLGARPVKVSGHLYLPATVLPHLGIDATADGTMLLINRWPLAEASGEGDYTTLAQTASVAAVIDVSRGVSLSATITLLSPELVQSAGWTGNTALRGRALEMLQDHVLLEVQLHNETTGFYGLQPTGLRLVDDMGRQYAPTGEVIQIEGEISGLLAPTAKARAILAFPAIQAGTAGFKLYSQQNAYPVAVFTLPQ